MAKPAATAPASYHHGDMPVVEHTETYVSVMGLFKWGALGVADLLILLTFWFCTPAGFMTGLVVAVLVAIVGVVALRSKPSAH